MSPLKRARCWFLPVFVLLLAPGVRADQLHAEVGHSVVHDVGQGWSSTCYVPTLGRFLAIFVNHYSPGGYQDNSLRAFDPATSTVEYIHPKDVPGAPSDRDNHQMVYNPFTDEIWITGSYHILDVVAAWAARDVPPGYGAVGWTPALDDAAFAAAADIQGWPAELRKWNAVVDWHPTLDIGLIWGGVAYTGLGVSNDLYIIAPNPTPGEERYVFIDAGNFDSVLAPPGYVPNYIYTTTFNGRHNGRILGDFFYTLTIDNTTSLTDNGDGTYNIHVDLLRFDLTAGDIGGSLTWMAPLVYTVPGNGGEPEPDLGMNFPCVTADTLHEVILVYLAKDAPNLYAFSPAIDSWQEVTADVTPRPQRLAGCDYSPDHNIHAYWSGTNAVTGEPYTDWSTIRLVNIDDDLAPAAPASLTVE